MLRILHGIWSIRPTDITAPVNGATEFHTFVPLKRSIELGLVEVIGHHVVPICEQGFPVFRNGVPDPATGKVRTWWLWDGAREWCIGELTIAQKKLPPMVCMTIPHLVQLIEQGWRPENDPSI
jgi:hypothetical protein